MYENGLKQIVATSEGDTEDIKKLINLSDLIIKCITL